MTRQNGTQAWLGNFDFSKKCIKNISERFDLRTPFWLSRSNVCSGKPNEVSSMGSIRQGSIALKPQSSPPSHQRVPLRLMSVWLDLQARTAQVRTNRKLPISSSAEPNQCLRSGVLVRTTRTSDALNPAAR